MTQEETIRQLVLMVDQHIARCLAEDGHCKSYEGTWSFATVYPNYWDRMAGVGPSYRVELHCYLIGPTRHYEWNGPDPESCLANVRKDVETWIAEDLENAD